MGICHRDVSLETILVKDYKTCVLKGCSTFLRVTYAADDGGVTDVSEGTLRLLTHPLIPCGKPNYISPEILKSEEAFDGFAVDLWASAVILFIMLVGVPPWEFANAEDPRYRIVTSGGLVRMLESWKRPISASAADLLQKMLKEDPRQRLSLTEVQNHPWVLADEPPRAADCT
jgi:serine/threonine protein kinase